MWHLRGQSSEMRSRFMRCLMVGLPWGQFHGCSISPMWTRSFLISVALRAVPIITCRHKCFLLLQISELLHIWTLNIEQWCLVTRSQNIATHRFSTRTRGKHVPNAGGSAHDPRAVTQHEDQLFNVSRSKCPVLTRRQGYQFHPLHHLSYIHNK